MIDTTELLLAESRRGYATVYSEILRMRKILVKNICSKKWTGQIVFKNF
jgi:hypothetical protein